MELADRVALVTGGGRGIGRAVALALAGAGARVAVVARSPDQLAETVDLMGRGGGGGLAVPCDVTDPAAVNGCVAQVVAGLGPVDILVNNAGVAPSMKLQDTTDAVWQQVLAVNLSAAFYFCRALVPGMAERRWGRVINVASTAAKVGYMYTAAYVASKHGVLGLTRALALEVARRGVTVNAICPGFVDTEISARAVANLQNHTGRSPGEARQALEGFSPQGRLMDPEEIAALVVNLCSYAARGINGQGIVIDGGGVQT